MATTYTTRPAPFGALATFRFITFLDKIRTSFLGWSNTRATQNALSRLSDHELNDIGLSRGDIDNIGTLRK